MSAVSKARRRVKRFDGPAGLFTVRPGHDLAITRLIKARRIVNAAERRKADAS